MSKPHKFFGVFFNRYFWQTAVLIAQNGLARQYRNSFLGMFWTLLQPLVMVTVYSFVMPKIMRVQMDNYLLYVLVSLPLWTFFNITLIGASHSIISNGETLKRCMVSSSLFPIADVLKNVYTYFVSFAVMYGVAMLIGRAPLNPFVLLIPLYFIPVLMIIGAGAIAIAFIAPYIRDIGEVVMVFMTVLFWLTPVVYPISTLSPRTQVWMVWNPFHIMMAPIQTLAYEHTLPNIGEMTHLLGLTLIAILLGLAIFMRCRRNYVYYL